MTAARSRRAAALLAVGLPRRGRAGAGATSTASSTRTASRTTRTCRATRGSARSPGAPRPPPPPLGRQQPGRGEVRRRDRAARRQPRRGQRAGEGGHQGRVQLRQPRHLPRRGAGADAADAGDARLRNVDNPFNPSQNIDGGVRHLKYLLSTFGDTKLALAAYNAGENAVRKYNGVPRTPRRRTTSRRCSRTTGATAGWSRRPAAAAAAAPPPPAQIQTFVNAEGTRVFTNVPWKYLEAPGWQRERAP